MNKIFELYKKYKEIIMYLVFGVATTVVNWIVYIICNYFCCNIWFLLYNGG